MGKKVLVLDLDPQGNATSGLGLQKSKIKKIIYVSCNPSTLAKNINHLQRNYKVSYIQPLDMFPNTANVETVVLLTKR